MKHEGCKDCPLGRRRSRTYVKPYIPAQHDGIAWVGEQPWTTEARQGLPFVGRSGKLLRSTAASHGLDLNGSAVLNAIGCFAGDWPRGKEGEEASLESTHRGRRTSSCWPNA